MGLAAVETNCENNMTTRRKARNQEKEVEQKPRPLVGKTTNQKDYIRAIAENDVIFCSGPAGSGKSYIASGVAAHKLFRGEIEQIIVTRPLVCTGKELGALPGNVSEKIMPHLAPMEENLKYFLQRVNYGKFMNDGVIRYEPLELMRGATFHDAYMILDEAQNCSVDQIKMFITRMGQNTKVLINGDTNQTDLHGHSGLAYCMNKLARVNGVGVSKLDYQDIQRNGIIGRVLSVLEGDGTAQQVNDNFYDDDYEYNGDYYEGL